jgi:hypothetical protein
MGLTRLRSLGIHPRSELRVSFRKTFGVANNVLWLQLDHMLLVVYAHGVELIQNVLPQQTVELNSEAPRKPLQVHHRTRAVMHSVMQFL